MEIIKKHFPIKQNETGCLTFLESQKDVPFEIKRIYFIYDMSQGARRGFHAHLSLQQYMLCLSGSCKILLEDRNEQQVVNMDVPNEGLYIGPFVWHEMYDFSPGTVLLVLASDYYNEDDYVRDYNIFKKYVSNK